MKTNRLIFNSSFKIWHIILGVFIFSLFIFLSYRASNEYRWSDWGFGDAQTMLSLRHWKEEGWIANKFLFIPQGYAKTVKLFDEPALRHHAHGICPASSPRIGPRLWYTHYPSGYLMPYAILFSLGLDNIFAMRMLSVFFSIGAIIFMYLLFSKITSPSISFTAVLFYGLSSAFLGYADSLANQPIDDLFRFAFMLSTVFYTRASSSKQRKLWLLSAWIIQFLLSLSSYDSVLFVYLWFIGWDLLEHRRFRWKIYLVYLTAPLIAHSLEFIQNAWYLGLGDAVMDIKVTFLARSSADKIQPNHLIIIWHNLVLLFNSIFNNSYSLTVFKAGIIILLLLISYAVYYIFFRDRNSRKFPSPELLAVLFFCGLIFGFIFPPKVPYEIRQIMPFVAVLASAATWFFLRGFARALHYKGDEESLPKRKILIPYLLLSAVVLSLFWHHFVFSNREPICNINVTKNHPDTLLAKEIKLMPTIYEPIIFDMGGFESFLNSNYVQGYPQIHPIIEYYAGSRPILCFTDSYELASDLLYLLNRSPYKFSPLLITRDLKHIKAALRYLDEEGVLSLESTPVYSVVMGRYIVDLTGCLKR